MLERLIDYFIPDDFPDPTGVETRRARIGVIITIIANFWAFVAGTLGLASGNIHVGVGLLIGAVVMSLAPFVLRNTGNLSLAGHCIIIPAYVTIVAMVYSTGGLYSAAILWLPLLPLLATIYQSNRNALAWVFVVGATIALMTVGMLVDYPFPQAKSRVGSYIQFGVALIGMMGTTYALLQFKNNVQIWLSDALREKEAETRAVLETAPDAILTVGGDGQILSVNRATARMFNASREEILALNIQDLVADLDPVSLNALLKTRGFGESVELTSTRAGSEFPVEIAFGHHDSRIVLVLRDITERKVANQALRSARDQAIEASRAKSAFLANMSHELRTPLNAVIGYSEMIKEEIEIMYDEKVENIEVITDFLPDLTRIRTAGAHLLALINDILDLSKIEAGKMDLHLEEFEVDALIEEIESTIAPLAKKGNNRVVIERSDALGTMNSDITKVRQILLNLLSNACKFTKEGSVTVRISPAENNAKLIFEIEDTGVGMSESQLQKIFEAFTQADASTTRQYGGTGLGLTITRHFCSLLGGEVEVESSLGQGSVFRVHLPRDNSTDIPAEIAA
ncbi:sensor histidine kinase [Bradymonas sediminis]|uniref:histidine kinase n=1 Tax=Bradymonas sediminis TaxID=1548548 RepID=A0A2Z4FJ84_9DELT|nr:ATP-binding protein [Bradymonas sediminis]AWV88746.1 hypothetical protein DN745_05095 [Bradymonas sediminis]TDP63561.1 PAS domain S-box-containing protein [Bradymonas sediminis]